MDNKFNNMLQEFLKNNNIESLEEANEKLQEFIMMYNNGEIEYENTPLDDAYEMLKEAEDRNKDIPFLTDLPFLSKNYLGFLPYLFVKIRFTLRKLLWQN